MEELSFSMKLVRCRWRFKPKCSASLECGELQRIGDNETTRVDVRVIAATHQPLEQRAEERAFRLDLYHRLAVFPLTVPALRERIEDLPKLTDFFLERLAKPMSRKTLASSALTVLSSYAWPGNVRELMHVLERGMILAEERTEIGPAEIRLRRNHRAEQCTSPVHRVEASAKVVCIFHSSGVTSPRRC